MEKAQVTGIIENEKKRMSSQTMRIIILLVMTLVMFSAQCVKAPGIISSGASIYNYLIRTVMGIESVAIIAIGVTFVIITGNNDMSTASLYQFTAVMACTFTAQYRDLLGDTGASLMAIVVPLAVGAVIGPVSYTHLKVTMESDSYVLAAGGDSFKITVRPLDLSGEEVVLSVEEPLTVGYTGASVYPQIGGDMLEVELNGKYRGALPADCFTIEAAEGKNDVNAGDAYLTIVGQGNATGEAKLAYTIIAKSIAAASVTVEPIPGQTYTGTALEPSVTVKDGGKALVKDVDYAATYANNTAVGAATVTITGKGNYTGETKVTFEIVRKDIAEDEGFTIDPIPEMCIRDRSPTGRG